jgi:DTW domain-containing protein YfiP
MCLCDLVPSLDNQTRVHVLQHRKERRHPLGTARLLRLGLHACDVRVLGLRGRSGEAAPLNLPPGTGLLYPSADAIPLEGLAAESRPRHLAVIDGTWTQAHRIYRDTPWLHALPHYRLTPVEESRYRIRTEPRPDCLSTLEATVAALRLLEPELEGIDALLAAFDGMIDAQIDAHEEARRTGAQRRAKRRRRQRASRVVPEALRAPPGRIVLVFAEAAPNPATWQTPHDPIRVSATPLDRATVFDAFVRPLTPPDQVATRHLEVDPSALVDARPAAEVHAELDAWLPADTVLVSWGKWTDGLLASWFPEAQRVLLRTVTSNLMGSKARGVEHASEVFSLTPAPQHLPGRAGRRLAHMGAVLDHVRTTP